MAQLRDLSGSVRLASRHMSSLSIVLRRQRDSNALFIVMPADAIAAGMFGVFESAAAPIYDFRRSTQRANMAFVVQAKSRRPGEGSFWADKATRKDAIVTAWDLLAQGMEWVTITDEEGRVFELQEFATFFAGNY